MSSDRQMLTKLLSHISRSAETIADDLISHYGDLLRISEANIDELSGILHSQSLAIYIKLTISIASRRVTDNFKFGKKHTKEEIEEYLKALFLGKCVETVYAILFDSEGRVISCEALGDGTVNQSALLPRKLLDVVMKKGASAVVLAHNHPGGYPTPSNADRANTATLYTILVSSGIKLLSHYIFAGYEFEIMECNFED